jgi:hypothetical protein
LTPQGELSRGRDSEAAQPDSAMEQRLNTMLEVIKIVQPAQTFYRTLTG